MSTEKNSTEMTDIEKVSFIYPLLTEEINRYRDWPVKVLAFTSAFHFAIIGAFLLESPQFGLWSEIVLSFIILTLWIWTLYYLCVCHKNYLEARNIQFLIQKKLSLDTWIVTGKEIFPKNWFPLMKVSIWNRKWGWGFYAFYATLLLLFTLTVIWRI